MAETKLQQISVDVDGVEVTGEIKHHSRRCVAVRLIRPFGRLTAACTVPYFAAPYTSFDGESGLNVARQLLVDAFKRAQLFDEHEHSLRKLWRSTQAKLLALDAADPGAHAQIAEDRRKLRALRIAGEVTTHEYQTLLRSLHRRKRDYARRRFEILREFEEARPWDDDVGVSEVVSFLGEDETGLYPHDSLTSRALHVEDDEGGKA